MKYSNYFLAFLVLAIIGFVLCYHSRGRSVEPQPWMGIWDPYNEQISDWPVKNMNYRFDNFRVGGQSLSDATTTADGYCCGGPSQDDPSERKPNGCTKAKTHEDCMEMGFNDGFPGGCGWTKDPCTSPPSPTPPKPAPSTKSCDDLMNEHKNVKQEMKGLMEKNRHVQNQLKHKDCKSSGTLFGVKPSDSKSGRPK